MKIYIAIVILIFLTCESWSQNLVPNSSFEEYDTCPDNYSQFNRAIGWFYVTDATTDFFNSCQTIIPDNVSVPQNFAGYQNAHTGVGYAGAFFTAGDTLYFGSYFQWIEYMGIRLKQPMKNTLYKVSFYVSLADSLADRSDFNSRASQSLNIFNCAFLKNSIYQSGSDILNVNPDIEVSFAQPVVDSLGWTKVESFYYGRDGDEYIIIGQMNKDFNKYKSHFYNYSLGYKLILAYYYYDDVEVIQVGDDEFPNVFSPNEDGINDEFDLRISCLNCGLQLQIFNRWGNLLVENNTFKWDGKCKGESCPDGVYYYVLSDTINNRNVHSGFFQLIK